MDGALRGFLAAVVVLALAQLIALMVVALIEWRCRR
jgi:hypothetical protein